VEEHSISLPITISVEEESVIQTIETSKSSIWKNNDMKKKTINLQ